MNQDWKKRLTHPSYGRVDLPSINAATLKVRQDRPVLRWQSNPRQRSQLGFSKIVIRSPAATFSRTVVLPLGQFTSSLSIFGAWPNPI